MSACGACGAGNAAGSLFCVGCALPLGLPLGGAVAVAPSPIAPPLAPVAPSAPVAPVGAPAVQAVALVELRNGVPTGRVLDLPDTAWTGTLLVGRPDLASGVVVDVDLDPYDARAKGVSRRHARLDWVAMPHGATRVQVADWASAHGTWVDKTRLAAGASAELAAGTEVRFADLVFRVELA